MRGAVQWSHLERAAPPPKPGLKVRPGTHQWGGGHTRNHTSPQNTRATVHTSHSEAESQREDGVNGEQTRSRESGDGQNHLLRSKR